MGRVDVHSHFRVQPTGSVVVGVVTTTITTITTITTTTTTIFLGCYLIDLNLVFYLNFLEQDVFNQIFLDLNSLSWTKFF